MKTTNLLSIAKIKNIIAAVIIIFCHSHTHAQMAGLTPKQRLNEHKIQIEKTDYIFEGTVTQQKYYNKKSQVVHTSIIQITKIFKGSQQLKLGSIKVITDQYFMTNGVYLPPSDEGGGVTPVKGGTYILFCRPASLSWFADSTTTDNIGILTTMSMDYPITISGSFYNNGKVSVTTRDAAVQWEDTPQFKTLDDIYGFFKENGVEVQEEVEQENK